MPTYVYGCPSCDVVLEMRRPISQRDDPTPCPVCGDQCARVLTSCNVASRDGAKQAAADQTSAAPAKAARHPAGCSCCRPVRSTPAPKASTA